MCICLISDDDLYLWKVCVHFFLVESRFSRIHRQRFAHVRRPHRRSSRDCVWTWKVSSSWYSVFSHVDIWDAVWELWMYVFQVFPYFDCLRCPHATYKFTIKRYRKLVPALLWVLYASVKMTIGVWLNNTLQLLKKGDRVVMPFNVACGRCLNCEEGKSAFCTHVNPGFVSCRSSNFYNLFAYRMMLSRQEGKLFCTWNFEQSSLSNTRLTQSLRVRRSSICRLRYIDWRDLAM